MSFLSMSSRRTGEGGLNGGGDGHSVTVVVGMCVLGFGDGVVFCVASLVLCAIGGGRVLGDGGWMVGLPPGLLVVAGRSSEPLEFKDVRVVGGVKRVSSARGFFLFLKAF